MASHAVQTAAAPRAARAGALVLAATALLSTGCPPSRGAGGPGTGGLAAGAAGGLGTLDVRRTRERPALTLLVREGDPRPAVAVAVATDLGGTAAVALAAIAEVRLRAAGFPVRTRVDQLGFRLTLSPARAPQMEGFVAALAQSFTRPVTANEPATRRVAELWGALRRHPLAAPALDAVAACTGELGVLVPSRELELSPTTVDGAKQLDGWRAQALTAERSAVAAVGPTELVQALARALERSTAWPSSSAAWTVKPPDINHGVFVAPSAPAGGAVLQLAIALDDPHRATTAGAELGHAQSPLALKLASAFPSWQLDEVRVTVTPAGGCVALQVATTPDGASPMTTRGSEAAAIAQLALGEVTAEARREPDRFLATRNIITASSADEAAARAAWWSLANAGPPREPTMTSALGVGPGRGELGSRERDALQAAFGRALAESLPKRGQQRPGPKVGVERGQGEVWVLVGSACGTGSETPTESGQAALGALAAVMAQGDTEQVQLEPWISPQGVGVLAHGAPLSATESPAELAVRVGRMAGRAFAGGPGRLDRFVDAQRRLHEQLDDGSLTVAYDLARAALPAHPSRLAPLGPSVHAEEASLERVRERWRSLQRSPIRIAVLGNTDATQASTAAHEVERWLLPARFVQACSTQATDRAALGKGGLYRAASGGSGSSRARIAAAVVLARPDAMDRRLAALTIAALDGNGGVLASLAAADGVSGTSAHWLDWTDGLGLLIELDVVPSQLEQVDARLVSLLETWGKNGPTTGQLQRAATIEAARRATSQADPRARLESLWSGSHAAAADAPLAREHWARWLADLLLRERIVRVRAEPSPGPAAAP